MRPDDDEYLDEESERTRPRSLLASGWVRALLVLGALVLVLFVAVPYALRSRDRQPPEPPRMAVKPAPSPPPAASPSAAPPATTAPAATTTSPAQAPALATPAPAASTPAGPPPAKTGRREVATAKEQAKAEPKAPAETPRTPAPARPAKEKESVVAAASGEFWVQAGAFESDRNAERLAERLRQDRPGASVARVTRGGDAAARHEIVVTGANAGAVNTLLQGKGSARAVSGTVVVEPSLELKEAVALSKRLAAEGLTVKIRRVGNGAATTLHVVSVGPYPTRAGAEASAKELAAQGVRGFVRQGPAR